MAGVYPLCHCSVKRKRSLFIDSNHKQRSQLLSVCCADIELSLHYHQHWQHHSWPGTLPSKSYKGSRILHGRGPFSRTAFSFYIRFGEPCRCVFAAIRLTDVGHDRVSCSFPDYVPKCDGHDRACPHSCAFLVGGYYHAMVHLFRPTARMASHIMDFTSLGGSEIKLSSRLFSPEAPKLPRDGFSVKRQCTVICATCRYTHMIQNLSKTGPTDWIFTSRFSSSRQTCILM